MRSAAPIVIFAAFGALTLSPVGANAQWSDLGLSGREVRQLRSRHGLLYACSDNGLYRKASDTADSAWVLLGFAGQRVHDVLAVSPETLIVAREITGTGADTVALLRSTDGGANWSPFQNGLGAGSPADRKVSALLVPPATPGTLLAATWVGIHKSTDGGLTWKRVSTAGLCYFLASGVSTLWGGGTGFALSPFARRSTNEGETWTASFASGVDGSARAMAFDPSDSNVAFLGLDGSSGFYRTANDGVSWTAIPLPTGVGSSALGARAFPPLRLYANGVPPAVFYKTDDGGTSWTLVSFADGGSTVTRSILVRSGASADTLFLGRGSGVLRYVELQLVGVDPPVRKSQLELGVHPNPFGAGTALMFQLPQASHVTLRVLDSGGREVARLLDSDHSAGPHRLIWTARGLPSGTYFCQLRAGSEVAVRKIIIVR